MLYSIWHALRDLVVVRQLDQPIATLLTDDQQANVNLHVMALLQQAQWAVLHQDQTVYQLSLLKTQQMVNRYFMVDQTATQSMLINLKKLSALTIAPQYPDISQTVVVVQNLSRKT